MTEKIENVRRQIPNTKRFIPFFWMIILLIVTPSSFANGDDAEIAHLCKEGEEVVFSCMTGKKNISFCATPRYTADKGFMTYRFGTAGQKLEMEYPSIPSPVVNAFRVSGLHVERPKKLETTPSSIYWRQQAAIEFQRKHAIALPDGSYTEIAFQKGAYTYTFFHQITNWIYQGRYDGAGLVVERTGRAPVELLCNDPVQAVGGKGTDSNSRFFPRRLDYLNNQFHMKNDYKFEAQGFHGVSPLNRDRSIESQQPRSE